MLRACAIGLRTGRRLSLTSQRDSFCKASSIAAGRAPDLLEQRRKTARLEFVGVDAGYTLAGGGIGVHPIDGIGSEVALIGYVFADHLLWASDYI